MWVIISEKSEWEAELLWLTKALAVLVSHDEPRAHIGGWAPGLEE